MWIKRIIYILVCVELVFIGQFIIELKVGAPYGMNHYFNKEDIQGFHPNWWISYATADTSFISTYIDKEQMTVLYEGLKFSEGGNSSRIPPIDKILSCAYHDDSLYVKYLSKQDTIMVRPCKNYDINSAKCQFEQVSSIPINPLFEYQIDGNEALLFAITLMKWNTIKWFMLVLLLLLFLCILRARRSRTMQ